MRKVVRIIVKDGLYTADATWLSGSPPIAQNWSSQELAIAVLRDMVAVDSGLPEKETWGDWPEYYDVECQRG